jgi:hypothetical protein
MEAEESKHTNIKEEVKVLDEQYQKTKKEYDVSKHIMVGTLMGHSLKPVLVIEC